MAKAGSDSLKNYHHDLTTFIFDPECNTNQKYYNLQDHSKNLWDLYPKSLRDLFIKSFTEGIRHPKESRVSASEWCIALARLVDSVINCQTCDNQSFYSLKALKISGGQMGNCENCGQALHLPPRMRVNGQIIVLNPKTKIYPHHIDSTRCCDFNKPIGVVVENLAMTTSLSLKNLSNQEWMVSHYDGTSSCINSGQSVSIEHDISIDFVTAEAEIRVDVST